MNHDLLIPTDFDPFAPGVLDAVEQVENLAMDEVFDRLICRRRALRVSNYQTSDQYYLHAENIPLTAIGYIGESNTSVENLKVELASTPEEHHARLSASFNHLELTFDEESHHQSVTILNADGDAKTYQIDQPVIDAILSGIVVSNARNDPDFFTAFRSPLSEPYAAIESCSRVLAQLSGEFEVTTSAFFASANKSFLAELTERDAPDTQSLVSDLTLNYRPVDTRVEGSSIAYENLRPDTVPAMKIAASLTDIPPEDLPLRDIVSQPLQVERIEIDPSQAQVDYAAWAKMCTEFTTLINPLLDDPLD